MPLGYVVGALFVVPCKPQLSLVVGVPSVTPDAAHKPVVVFTETVAGQVIVGFWLSVTVTVWLHVAVRLFTSVTVQITVVFPEVKVVGALWVVLCTPQLSPVVGVPSETPDAVQRPTVVPTETVAGQVIVGFWLSLTVTEKPQIAELPDESVACQLTIVVPDGNCAPLDGPSVCVTVGFPQLSEAVGAAKVTTALQRPASVFCTMFSGHTMLGFWASVMVTVCSQVAVNPYSSVTVQVTVLAPAV